MDVTPLSELRIAKYEAEIRAKNAETEARNKEVEFATLKIEEMKRNMSLEKSLPSESRILTFAAEIEPMSTQQAIRTLDIWSRQTPECDMTIIFNSPGGDVLSGFALHDYIVELRRRGHYITTKVVGAAMSMAAVVLQAGDERVITPNSFVLIHEVSGEVAGTVAKIDEELRIIERLQEKCLNILSERSEMPVKAIGRRWKNKDWLLDADEALELGFVDRIEE